MLLDMNEIEPGLWQGSDPGTDLPSYITVIVSLRSELPPPMPVQHMHGVLWMPTADGEFHGLRWLDLIVDYVAAALRAKWGVLVYCAAGISRSTLITAAYLMKKRHLCAEEALAFVKSKRSFASPAPCYIRALKEYEMYIFGEAECSTSACNSPSSSG